MIEEKYKCIKCGYIYTYKKYDNGSKSNVPFDDLKIEWVCPTCESSKIRFKELKN